MNLRHSAALALVGWYLMTPPHNGSLSAPLFAWVGPKKSFSSLDECSKMRKQILEHEQQFMQEPVVEKRLRTPQERQDFVSTLAHSKCIASDDPRLTPPSNIKRPHSLTAVVKERSS
jgi:hypothetical protein